MKYTPTQHSIKLFWILVNPLRTMYWFAVRPHTTGVKCLIENNGAFLLCRLNYGHRQWTFPGGGVNRKESPEDAAKRESHEEVGIMPEKVTRLGEYMNTHQYKIDTVHVYACHVPTRDFKIDGFEIAEAAWFDAASLPKERRPTVDRLIQMYQDFT